MSDLSLVLSRLDKAEVLLLQCTDALSAKRVADMAKAAEVFATKQKSDVHKSLAHQLWVDALRLEGEFLACQPKNVGGQPTHKRNSTRSTKEQVEKIPRKESATAQMVNRAAKSEPELFGRVRSGKAKLNDIRRHFNKQEHLAKIEAAADAVRIIQSGPYDIILADPPWKYEHCEANNREIENHYETMTLEGIRKLNVNAKKDCILFLWATAPKLEEALSVMNIWGFNYRTCAVWDKEVIGMGYWFRVQHELLLVGVKGSPKCPPESERISSIIKSKRTKHSAKPDCLSEWIERAYPGSSKVEMFCRKPRPGWAWHGNEVIESSD